MSPPRLFFFVLLPVGVGLLLQALYFSGVPALEGIIVPRIEGLTDNSRREFGLLEMLQNVVLVAVFVLALIGLRRAPRPVHRSLFVMIAGVAVFVLLEEVDYGLHLYEYAAGVTEERPPETRNWHNQGRRNVNTKRVVDAAMIVWFFLVPLTTWRVRHGGWRSVLPGRWYAATVVCAWLLSELAHALSDAGLNPDGRMNSNISEFRELNTYYIGLVYVYELAVLRTRGSPDTPDAAA